MDCSCGTHPSAFTKLNFGWVDPNTVATVPAASGTANLTLHALSQPLSTAPAPGRVHAIKLPSATGSRYHLLEARFHTDRYETATPNEGVVIYWIDESSWPPVHLKTVLTSVGATYSDAAEGLSVTLSAAAPSGFAVAIDRTPPAECTWIRGELTNMEAEIRGLQAELQHAAPGEKAFLIAQIKRLQAQAAKLRAGAQQLGCPL